MYPKVKETGWWCPLGEAFKCPSQAGQRTVSTAEQLWSFFPLHRRFQTVIVGFYLRLTAACTQFICYRCTATNTPPVTDICRSVFGRHVGGKMKTQAHEHRLTLKCTLRNLNEQEAVFIKGRNRKGDPGLSGV